MYQVIATSRLGRRYDLGRFTNEDAAKKCLADSGPDAEIVEVDNDEDATVCTASYSRYRL